MSSKNIFSPQLAERKAEVFKNGEKIIRGVVLL